MAGLVQRVEDALSAMQPAVSAAHVPQYVSLLQELERWNRKVNLTAIRDPDEMISVHLLDSLMVRPLLAGARILDIGTGAGFPGLPLAIVEPERQFDLVDSNLKRIMFVQHVAGLIGLENVNVVQSRGEDYAPGHRFDTVLARAVATLPRLLDIAGHHVEGSGVFVALKGRYPAKELKDVPNEWEYDVLELDVPGLEKESRHAVLLRRVA